MSRSARLASIGAVALLSFYLLTALLVPRLVDVDVLRPRIESRLGALVGRSVHLGTLRLSLWTGVEIKADGVHVAKDGGGATLDAELLAARPRVLPLLRRDVRLRSLRIERGALGSGERRTLRDLSVRCVLSEAEEGTERVDGELRGRFGAESRSRQVALTFRALARSDRVVLETIDARIGPLRAEVSGELSRLEEGSPILSLRGRGTIGKTVTDGTLTLEARGEGTVVSFALHSPLVDFDEIAALLRQPARGTAVSSLLAPSVVAAEESESPKEGSFLASTKGGGSIKADRGRMAGIEITDLSSTVLLEAGRLRFDAARFTVHGGTSETTVEIDLAQPRTPFRIEGKAEGVDVRSLVRSAAPTHGDALAGTATLALDLAGEAGAPGSVHTLRGEAKLEIRNGKLTTLGILKQVAMVLEMVGGRGIGQDETPFDHLTAGFTVKEGIASTKDLEFRSPDLDLDGGGTIDLGGPLRLQVLASFSKAASDDFVKSTPQLKFRVGPDGRMTVPLQFRGTLRNPHVQLDMDRVLQEGLKQSLKDSAKKSLLKRLLRKD